MRLIVQRKALQAASGLSQIMPVLRKRDRSLFEQVHRAMNSVVLNIGEADGNDPGTSKARFASALPVPVSVKTSSLERPAYPLLHWRPSPDAPR